jgi:hypothetical protein
MEATSLLQSFAIAKDGRVVSVNEVERGQACGCTCPACRRPLIARQGEVRVWHFAHATGADCEGGAESALHLAAKTAIERAGGITLPGLSVKRTLTLPDGRRGTGEASIPETTWIDFIPDDRWSVLPDRGDKRAILGNPRSSDLPDVGGLEETWCMASAGSVVPALWWAMAAIP